MKRIAITGGIGSGKSYVCRLLEGRGIEIYDCDAGAKRLMRSSELIKKQLTELIGHNTYVEGELNKVAVASFLLASEENKKAINAIVHPAVIEDFYSSGLQWMECAILHEASLEDNVDIVICVSAPEHVRLQRVMQRDGISEEKAMAWINTQLSQDYVEKKSDFVVLNDGETDVESEIDNVLKKISELY